MTRSTTGSPGAMVTGGSRGIGAARARLLTDIRDRGGEAVDTTNPDALTYASARLEARYGPVDLLAWAAGHRERIPAEVAMFEGNNGRVRRPRSR